MAEPDAWVDRRCPRCLVGFPMFLGINVSTAFSCGHLDLTVEQGAVVVGSRVEVACPHCLKVTPRTVYDVGSGLEVSCLDCEWCWLIAGDQMLYPQIDIETIEMMPSWAREGQYARCKTCYAPQGHCVRTDPEHGYTPLKAPEPEPIAET